MCLELSDRRYSECPNCAGIHGADAVLGKRRWVDRLADHPSDRRYSAKDVDGFAAPGGALLDLRQWLMLGCPSLQVRALDQAEALLLAR
ncbi:MAG: hypothetical protein ACRDS9_19310 [Pseudonocardiaceae bacterium]